MLMKKNGFMLLSVFMCVVSVNAYAGISEDAKDAKDKFKKDSKSAYEKAKEDSKEAYEKAKSFIKGE